MQSIETARQELASGRNDPAGRFRYPFLQLVDTSRYSLRMTHSEFAFYSLDVAGSADPKCDSGEAPEPLGAPLTIAVKHALVSGRAS
jgi:hypothetical protein